MPFGEYKDFDACVAANQDKQNPEGFCAELHRKITGEYPGASKSVLELTREQVEKICPSCAKDMLSKGMTTLRFREGEPPGKLAAAILKVTDPGFFRHCMDEIVPETNVSDPEAFCASLHEKLTGIWPGEHASEKSRSPGTPNFEIAKVDEAERLVFGWAAVAVKDGDVLITDSQGDQIEPPELEKAAYAFVEHHRVANEMHAGRPVGQLVESFVVTPEKLLKMGLRTDGAPRVAHWVGFRLSPETFGKVKAGKLRMFSIEGSAKRVAA